MFTSIRTPFFICRKKRTRRSETKWILPIRFFWWRNKIWLLLERRQSLQRIRVDIVAVSIRVDDVVPF
jgi:hypothetical protein